MLIARHTVTPLLVLLVCAACGGVRIPLDRPMWVRPARHLGRASRPVRVQRVPSHRAPNPARLTQRRPRCPAAAVKCFPATG
jgi:hypothetical protein